MKSIARNCLVGFMTLSALAAPIRLTAQEQPESSTSAGAVTPNPVPLINQPLVPDAAKPGGAAFTLTVNGTGFVSGAVVKWNGSPLATAFISGSSLRASVPASNSAKAGTALVTVVNPGPEGRPSNVIFFPVALPVNLVFGESAFSVGTGPWAVAVGDFNGDSKLDLAVTNNTDGTVTILAGNGDGSFKALGTAATGQHPQGITAADFNGDGKLDLAIANQGSGTVSILLGKGDGTFEARQDYSTGQSPQTVAVADFNGDGKLDLAVANYGPDYQNSTVSILLGNGDGTFQPQVAYDAGVNPVGVLVGDFNRDGKLDLAVLDNNAPFGVSILLGNGDGSFGNPVLYTAGTNSRVGMVADFNGDGKLDLAVANYTDNDVSILFGNGDGSFQPPVNYPVGGSPTALMGADFNGDGKLDLATSNQTTNSMSVLQGNGNGTFQAHVDYPTGSGPSGIAVGDFKADGRLDLALPNLTGNTISLLLQDGAVSLLPTNLNFGVQVVGSSNTKTVTLTNDGTTALTINSIDVSGTNPADFFQNNTCPSSLGAGAHCTVSVTFTPSQLGPATASLTITDSAPGSPQSVPLGGFGVASGPNATLSAKSLTFTTQLVGTSSPAQSVTLTNLGIQTLDISSIVAHGDFSQSHTCGSSLATLASCTIAVEFKPTQKGSRMGTLSITDNAANSPQTVNLNGTGTVVKLNPTGLAFGVHQVGTTSSQSTTLTNVGSTPLSTAIAIRGTDADEFSETNTCGSSVGAGNSCTITVTFKPSEKGSDAATVNISDNGGGSPQTVSLSGTGCVIVNHRCKAALTKAMQSALAASQTAVAPAPTGSSRVGTRIINLVDATRNDPFLNNGDKRELLVRFWYPASLDQDCTPAEYTSPRVWSHFAELTRLQLPSVSTNACLDAPVANSTHPVVVFTHGYTGTFTDYTFLFEDLASRGYVAVSIDHTYEATAVEFPDGRVVKSLVGSHLDNSWRMDEGTLSMVMSARLKDISFVVNELERLNTTLGNPFTGKLDTSRLALMGHSLGGEATIAGLEQESRFRVGVILDGVLADASAAETEQAVLILAAGREQWHKEECKLWTALKGPRLAVNLKGSEHLSLSDAVWLAKGAIKTGTTGPDKTIAAVRDYVSTFLDQNLRSGPVNSLLAGPSADYPDAEVTTQKQLLCGEAVNH